MDKIGYILFIKLYPFIAKFISPFNSKAALWVKGRKNIIDKLNSVLEKDDSKKIWMHCASLGEYEQGRPLLEQLKNHYTGYKFVLTFFSPSGYEVKQNSKEADYIFYLPIDSKNNAEDFLNAVNPSLIIFIKYDYWYYYLKEAHNRKIPLLLASGIFLPGFSFFQWYGKMRREMLTFFTHLFVQNENSKKLLQTINITNVSVAGDTRFDRVLQVAAEQKDFPEIIHFINNKKTIVAGSTWVDDDEALDHFANTHPELRFIIVPHDIGNARIEECRSLYHFSIPYSEYKNALDYNKPIAENINTLIIDNIGMLKFLYRYATICYIGGGFGNDGIHNILEAAVYGKPVIFGPEFEKNFEAVEMIESNGAISIENALELEKVLDKLLNDEVELKRRGEAARNYVYTKSGATKKIMDFIQENLLLTN